MTEIDGKLSVDIRVDKKQSQGKSNIVPQIYKTVAIKYIKKTDMRPEVLYDMQKEVEMLQSLSQDSCIDGIVKMIEYFEDFTHLVLVLEYLNSDDLQ